MTTPPLRYVAIGDSLSEGIGDEPWPDGTPRGWTDRLAELLGAHHGEVDYANLAVRGQRAHEVLATQVEAALVMEPDVVTLTAGMNDLLRPRFEPDRLRATLADVRATGLAESVEEAVLGECELAAVLTDRMGGPIGAVGVVATAEQWPLESSVASTDFSYSDPMKAHAAEAPNWTPEALQEFLANPKGVVPGTKMTFAGLPKPQERANVIAYLQAQ